MTNRRSPCGDRHHGNDELRNPAYLWSLRRGLVPERGIEAFAFGIENLRGEMNGLGFRIPWILRRTIGDWMTRRVLKNRSMPSVPTLPSLRPSAS